MPWHPGFGVSTAGSDLNPKKQSKLAGTRRPVRTGEEGSQPGMDEEPVFSLHLIQKHILTDNHN